MVTMLTRYAKKLFPAKQLLIRQQGEVKAVDMSTTKQCLLVVSGIFCLFFTAALASYSYWQHSQLANSQQHSLASHQQLAAQLSEQKQAHANTIKKHALAVKKIAELEQKQAFTQDVLASLPDALLPDQGLPWLIQQNSTLSLEQRIANAEQHYADTFDLLDHIIAKRQKQLDIALAKAGLPQAVMTALLAKSQPDAAQGGPLDAVAEEYLTEHQLSVVDKLLVLNQLEQLLAEVPQMLPAAKYYISSHFGLRKDPMTGKRAFHKGVDLASWKNTEIYAPADGKIVRAGYNGGYGRFIEIKHANGFTTHFAHLNKIKVKRGQKVTKGEVIALMGSTGRSTSTHLHYEVLHNGKHINPVKITKALAHVFEKQRDHNE